MQEAETFVCDLHRTSCDLRRSLHVAVIQLVVGCLHLAHRANLTSACRYKYMNGPPRSGNSMDGPSEGRRGNRYLLRRGHNPSALATGSRFPLLPPSYARRMVPSIAPSCAARAVSACPTARFPYPLPWPRARGHRAEAPPCSYCGARVCSTISGVTSARVAGSGLASSVAMTVSSVIEAPGRLARGAS